MREWIERVRQKPKWLVFALVTLALTLASLYWFYPSGKRHARIPVKFLPISGAPYVGARIHNRDYNLLVDLGGAFVSSLRKEIIQSIDPIEKEPTRTLFGIKNNLREVECYLIPLIQIENFKLIGTVAAQEDTENQARDCLIGLSDPELKHKSLEVSDHAVERLQMIDGSLGLFAFVKGKFFIDLPHAVLYSAESLDVLQREEQISIENYIKVPFVFDRGNAVVSISTDLGEKKFVFDTGASTTMLRESLLHKVDADAVGSDTWSWILQSREFVIGSVNFGPQDFLLYEFSKYFSHCDGILGLDFFKKHAIYFDFQEGMAYIQP